MIVTLLVNTAHIFVRKDFVETDAAFEGEDKVAFAAGVDAPPAGSERYWLADPFGHVKFYLTHYGVRCAVPYVLLCFGVSVSPSSEDCNLRDSWEWLARLTQDWGLLGASGARSSASV